MPWFTIETEETVRGVYDVEADNRQLARQMMEAGEITDPRVYEAIDMEVVRVEPQP